MLVLCLPLCIKTHPKLLLSWHVWDPLIALLLFCYKIYRLRHALALP